MEFAGSLHRPSPAEPDNRPAAVDTGDSSARLKTGMGPLLYTSASPVARMQIITRPLAGIPTEAGTRLSSRERSRLLIASLLTILFVSFLSFTVAVGSSVPDLGIALGTDTQGRQVVTWVVPAGIAYDAQVRPGDIIIRDKRDGSVRSVSIAQENGKPAYVSTDSVAFLSPLQRWGLLILALI